ncbi:MAG TPA: TonB-dependent receptor, partial [Flavobacterium sp.]|nr:TonB-dependent receptor [Flavobacterium sp.]
IAWNYGISFSQGFDLFGRMADIGFDLYRTDFTNQAVVDLYAGPDQVNFCNLDGKSFANSLQVDFNLEVIKHLNLRTAYKYYDIQTDYQSGTFERPMQARHRFFTNLEYATHIVDNGRQWKFDATYNWMGKQRLPSTQGNPVDDRLGDYANPFSVVNTQVTRTFSSVFEVYTGAENLFNYRQPRPILGADNPFGGNFDATIVYAPVFGRM